MFAVLGAVGVSAWRDGGDATFVVVVDVSPSCEPPSLRGDIRFDDAGLGAALARAAALSDADRIVLHTDAVFDHAPAASKPVDVVLRPRRDAFVILQIRAPERVPVGADFSIEIDVGRTTGPGKTARQAGFQLFRDEERVGAPTYPVRLERGQKRTIRVRDRVARGGSVRYSARLEGGAERARVVRIGDKPVVLSIGGRRRALDGFVWIQIPAERAAATLAQPGIEQGFDAILLEGGLESIRAQQFVANAVRGGVGLVVLRGQGFSDRPLENVLPLTDKPPGGRATLLLLDFSGSMESRQPQLRSAIARLKLALSPKDQIAFVAFRDEVISESDWTTVEDANWNLKIRATGNTNLNPALQRAAQRLENAPSASKRLFIVSDGEWSDVALAAETLKRFTGMYVAVLFVEQRVHEDVFENGFVAGDDLAAALRKVEESSPDRVVPGPMQAQYGDVPQWLKDAIPAPGAYEAVERLYPRGASERIALVAGEIPLVATLVPGGRVVMTALKALKDAPVGGLLRAVARAGAKVELTAERDGAALNLSARSDETGAFVVDGETVAARPAGLGRWSARIERVSNGAIDVRFLTALRLVPAASHDEMGGLTNRPDIAAEIARLSGGRVYRDAAPSSTGRGRAALYATFLGAAACVAWAALRRRSV